MSSVRISRISSRIVIGVATGHHHLVLQLLLLVVHLAHRLHRLVQRRAQLAEDEGVLARRLYGVPRWMSGWVAWWCITALRWCYVM
jgi:hypothetical protein